MYAGTVMIIWIRLCDENGVELKSHQRRSGGSDRFNSTTSAISIPIILLQVVLYMELNGLLTSVDDIEGMVLVGKRVYLTSLREGRLSVPYGIVVEMKLGWQLILDSRYFPTVYEPTVFENYVHGLFLPCSHVPFIPTLLFPRRPS